MLHRDLKTQNVFMTEREHLRLGDFGVSKARLQLACAASPRSYCRIHQRRPLVAYCGARFASGAWR